MTYIRQHLGNPLNYLLLILKQTQIEHLQGFFKPFLKKICLKNNSGWIVFRIDVHRQASLLVSV